MPTNNSCDYSPTQYNVQTGGANGTLNNVAPSATSGVPVISQGSSSQPIFGTAVVAGGGTGAATLTGLIYGNGTSAFTSVTYVPSTSWTPALAFGGGTTGITYGTQYGEYQRIGSIVFIACRIALTNKGSSTGAATLTGLPVAASSTSGSGTSIFMSLNSGNSTTNATYFYLDTTPSSTTLTIMYGLGASGTTAALTDATFANTTDIRFSGFYFV